MVGGSREFNLQEGVSISNSTVSAKYNKNLAYDTTMIYNTSRLGDACLGSFRSAAAAVALVSSLVLVPVGVSSGEMAGEPCEVGVRLPPPTTDGVSAVPLAGMAGSEGRCPASFAPAMILEGLPGSSMKFRILSACALAGPLDR